MCRSTNLIYFLFLLLFISCKEKLTGDGGKIIGRWEESGKKFDLKDSTNSVIWYEFDKETNADSYVGEFTYKLDTLKKTLIATTNMVGTDGHTKFKQVFFEKNYQIRKDTLVLSYTSPTTGALIKTTLVKRD